MKKATFMIKFHKLFCKKFEIDLIKKVFMLMLGTNVSYNCFAGSATSVSVTKRLEEYQRKTIAIAVVLDHLTVDTLQWFPDSRDLSTTPAMILDGTLAYDYPELSKRLLNVPWPWTLVSMAYCKPGEPTEEMRRNSRFFQDPFDRSSSLLYFSRTPTPIMGDYIIVSKGPDGVFDLRANIERWHTPNTGSGAFARADNQIDVLSRWMDRRAKLHCDEMAAVDDQASAVDRAMANAMYDPTNGLVSTGDIVFHRRYGRDSFIDFDDEVPLSRNRVQPIPLDRY